MSLKYSLSIPIIPGFLKLQKTGDLPLPKFGRKVWAPSTQLVDVALRRVLLDQFGEGDELGAWSRRYAEYLQFSFGDSLPHDISTKDTITFSALVVEDLVRFSGLELPVPLPNLLRNRLEHFVAYLFRHYDEEIGGFGRRGKVRSRGGAAIEVDLRHTLWALISLWELCRNDERAEYFFRQSSSYLQSAMERLDPVKDRAYTFAVAHRFISTDGLSSIFAVGEARRRSLLKQIEAALVAKYSAILNTWDSDRDPSDKLGIDNTLYTLRSVRLKRCIDSDLRQVLKQAVRGLLEKSAAETDDTGRLAIPFFPLGQPDLGATVRLCQLVSDEEEYTAIAGKRLDGLRQYINAPPTEVHSSAFSFSWHLSGALAMAGPREAAQP